MRLGDRVEQSARHVICEAQRLGMTQENGFVWFLPGWFGESWFDVDNLKNTTENEALKANCTTRDILKGRCQRSHP